MEVVVGGPKPRSSHRLRVPAAIHRIVWWALATSSVLFGLTTWDPTGTITSQILVRQFSVPILAIELAVVFLAMLEGFEPSASIRRAPFLIRLALAVLAAIAFGTAFFVAPDRPTALVRTCGMVLHVLLGLSLWHLFQASWRPLRPIVWQSLMIGSLVYIVLVAAFVASIPDPDHYDWVYFRLGVMNVRHLGYYSAVGACVALGLAINAPNRRFFLGYTLAIGVILALAFWSGTRGTLIAFGAAFAVGACVFPTLRTIKAGTSLLLSLILGMLFSLVQQPPNPSFGLFRIASSASQAASSDLTNGRVDLWIGAIRKFLERPFFGFGESQFQVIVPEALGRYKHPHDILLQLLLQWGLVGTACAIVLAIFLLSRFDRAARRIGPPAIPAYLMVAGVIAYSLFDGTLYYPHPIAMLAIALTWVLASEAEHA